MADRYPNLATALLITSITCSVVSLVCLMRPPAPHWVTSLNIVSVVLVLISVNLIRDSGRRES